MDKNVLIIDGHPVYIKKTEEFLRSLNFVHIDLARNGEQALEQLAFRNHDLVILSGKLPDTDSLKICLKVKEMNPSAKIIVQVGLFMLQTKKGQFENSGADIVLDRREKDLTALQSAIESLLNISTG